MKKCCSNPNIIRIDTSPKITVKQLMEMYQRNKKNTKHLAKMMDAYYNVWEYTVIKKKDLSARYECTNCKHVSCYIM